MGMGYLTAVRWGKFSLSIQRYLLDYYNHNQKKPNDGLEALAHKCAEMEGHMMFPLKRYAGVYAENVVIKITRTSERITKRMRETTNALESEFPVAAVAFKCITKEAELMCELLIYGATNPTFILMSNNIRRCAFIFMTYREPDYVPAAGTMMGVMEEANVMCNMFRKDHKDRNEYEMQSFFIRRRTLEAMIRIHNECSAVRESTGGNTAGKLVINESDVKTCSGKDLVKNHNLDEGNALGSLIDRASPSSVPLISRILTRRVGVAVLACVVSCTRVAVLVHFLAGFPEAEAILALIPFVCWLLLLPFFLFCVITCM